LFGKLTFQLSERILTMRVFISFGRTFAALGVLMLMTLAVGCARPSDSAHAGPDHDEHAASDGRKPHTHDGWWCDEHGVPEEVCGQCNAKLAAEFQKRGDWCAEHDRPDSQCFVCHPELKGKFAARYEAKLGTQPPEPRF
jgi:hypothetical protein